MKENDEMGWLLPAYRTRKLRITSDSNCPYCNPEKEIGKSTNLNACKDHLWVNKNWFEEWHYNKFGIGP